MNQRNARFDSISNLFASSTIDECYGEAIGEAEGLKDESGEWSIKGHPDRIIHYDYKKLTILAKLTSESAPMEARLLALQTKQMLDTIACFLDCRVLSQIVSGLSIMWDETYAQDDGILKRSSAGEALFPNSSRDMIYSGPHIAVANPVAKTPRKVCKEKGDYDCLDLTCLPIDYLQRSNYQVALSYAEYIAQMPRIVGQPVSMSYRLVSRKMLNLKQERTFNVSVVPPQTGHISGLVSVVFENIEELAVCAGAWASIPVDYYVKVLGKANFNNAVADNLPVLAKGSNERIVLRGLMLNCLTSF